MNLFEKIFGVRCVDCESYHKRIKGVDYQNINDFCSCDGSNPDFSQMVWSIPNPKELRKCIFYDRKEKK